MSRTLLLVCVALALVVACSEDGTKPDGSDTVPPATISDLAVTSPLGRVVTVTWTAPGDDGTQGRVTAYSLRYAAAPLIRENWDSAGVVPSPSVPKASGQTEEQDIFGLSDGTWHFALKAVDDAGNWSGISNVVEAEIADAIAPGRVSDLRVSTTLHSATLTWTAPGNDGMEGTAAAYDVRYARTYITEETWAAATQVEPVDPPGQVGTAEALTIEGLQSGQDYYFALKVADGRPNWSPLSNVASAAIVDNLPPAGVTDLLATEVTANTVTLEWTAPGDDENSGRAARYDIRYATSAITHWTWGAATSATGVPTPDSAGARETFTVVNLPSGRLYYIALKAADSVPNWSVLSNVVSAFPDSVPLRQLTSNPSPGTSGARNPAWSPTGDRIAFHADWTNTQGRSEIYTISVVDGSILRLTHDPAVRNAFPSWSPGGDKIAFSSGLLGDEWDELWVMGALDGSDATRLTNAGAFVKSSSWSSDGARIVYALWTGGPPAPIGIRLYLIPAAGGSPTALTDNQTVAWTPAWSPDGTRIAFMWNQSGYSEIWVISPDGTDPVQLTHTDTSGTQWPTWSPDGRRIAFSSRHTGNSEIFVMSAHGGDLTQLTFDPGSDMMPTWSPDGRQIAFASDRTGSYEIWILNLER